jgi:3-dehydroquinate dehydratase/shikimate dehydrogenase
VRELYAMAGDPVAHSLSPRIHNAGYRAVGRDALYVALQVGDFADFWNNVVEAEALDRIGIPLRGISVVSPYKAIAVTAASRRSEMVRRTRSTNLLRRDDEGWFAETTDADGVMLTLRDHSVSCRNRRAAVIGCGGSGRAMAAALQDAGADVTLVNRGFERGSLAVSLLHMSFMPLRSFSAERYSIFVNATPVGRDRDELPFAIDKLPRDAVIVDLAYRSDVTSLIRHTRGPGRVTIDGMEMLLTQALRQFRLMTGEEMPEGLARQVVGLPEHLAATEQR